MLDYQAPAAQEAPAPRRVTLVSGAVRAKDGKVYKAMWHFAATNLAVADGQLEENLSRGYITDAGDFLSAESVDRLWNSGDGPQDRRGW